MLDLLSTRPHSTSAQTQDISWCHPRSEICWHAQSFTVASITTSPSSLQHLRNRRRRFCLQSNRESKVIICSMYFHFNTRFLHAVHQGSASREMVCSPSPTRALIHEDSIHCSWLLVRWEGVHNSSSCSVPFKVPLTLPSVSLKYDLFVKTRFLDAMPLPHPEWVHALLIDRSSNLSSWKSNSRCQALPSQDDLDSLGHLATYVSSKYTCITWWCHALCD